MLIDDFDITTRKARVVNTTVENSEVKSASEWPRGSPLPVMLPGETGFKKVKQTIVIKGASREEILKNRSDIMAQLTEPRHLTIPGFTHKFHAALTKQTPNEDSKMFHTVKLEYDAYEYGEEITVSATGQTEITVNNPGNTETPATIEITPTLGIASLTIDGLFRDGITKEVETSILKDLATGKVIKIDGKTGEMTENGLSRYKADDELWTLPSLMPGTNKITFNTKNLNVKITFKSRYF